MKQIVESRCLAHSYGVATNCEAGMVPDVWSKKARPTTSRADAVWCSPVLTSFTLIMARDAARPGCAARTGQTVEIPLRFDPADVGGRVGVVRLKQTANTIDGASRRDTPS
jgi:hypothetical protein